jgi:integrase/recombinase XerD
MHRSSDVRCRVRQFMEAGDQAPLVAEFTRHLSQEGYTDHTLCGFDHAARHLAHWLAEAGIAIADIDEAVVGRFARHRCRCPGGRSKKQLSGRYVERARRFVAFLTERGVVRQQAARVTTTPDRRVVEFQDWLRRHRGLSERTIALHGYLLSRLLPALRPPPRRWDAQHIREVIIAETKRTARGHMKKLSSTLRSYLRFLSASGRCRAGLEHAVPIIADWRLSTLPRYIDTAQVEQLIATCDPSTPTGLRDRAILLLLARLGLRAGDIVSLRLGDLDWQWATLSVLGKGRRETRLPLPQDVGDAVLAYLERGRPLVESDRVFFMLNAPIRPLVDSRAVAGVVRGAIRKAGIDAPTKGASLLRHSAATAMLRGGATLDMVGAVLRHRSPDMTAHYAKVDVTMLRQIAQPWPADASGPTPERSRRAA